MATLVRERYGAGLSWALILSAVLLSGFGVVLGRFGRLNSWDVLRHPRWLLLNSYLAVTDPELTLRTYGTTLIFAAIMLACYLMFASRCTAQ